MRWIAAACYTLAGVGLSASSEAAPEPTFIQCSFQPLGAAPLLVFKIDSRGVSDVDSPNLNLKVIRLTKEQIILETNNRFFGFGVNRANGMASLTRITINRVNGAAWAIMTRNPADFSDKICPKDSGWTCVEQSMPAGTYVGTYSADGYCKAIRPRF